MSRWGCVGLTTGSLLGLLLLIVLVRVIRPVTPLTSVEPAPVASDVSLFLSERSVSSFASQSLGREVAINFEPGGQVILTTSVDIAGLKPVADLGLSLERQGPKVVSQLHWLQVGFVRVPAKWLPPEAIELASQAGTQMTSQLPPQFSLVELTTTADGISLQLDLTGE